jgi:hypothetical protein
MSYWDMFWTACFVACYTPMLIWALARSAMILGDKWKRR